MDGLLIPGTSTIDGKPMGGWPQYSVSPTMSIWTAQSFDEYDLYTGDMDFLRNRAYPFFTEIGQSIEGLLEEENGKLHATDEICFFADCILLLFVTFL